jgi:alkylated DNA repair dioxygenase AlkB
MGIWDPMPAPPSALEPPDGLVYLPEFLDVEEERALLDVLEPLEFQEIRMRGHVARRTARHYGIDYDYEQHGRLTPGEPLPDWLLALRERCAELAGLPPDELVEALVQRYPPGATIGWHRDAPSFGVVVGVSLGAGCRLRFQRGMGERRLVFEQRLEPRSAYVLAGSARWAWQHAIPPIRETRHSITFRSLRREAGADPSAEGAEAARLGAGRTIA